MRMMIRSLLLLTLAAAAGFAAEEVRPRSRDLGIVIGRFPPGPLDAITDVRGVRVGQVTRWFGGPDSPPGRGPARTGVTVVIPRQDVWHRKTPAAAWAANGCGELTGLSWINESGWLEVPIAMTNSHCVGRAFDGVITWMQKHNARIGIDEDVVDPVVGECDDSTLNDIRGRHVREADVVEALETARGGPVEEGTVGAGTGMWAFGFKGGIGTASRVVSQKTGAWTVGALVNSNCGDVGELTILGVPVGRALEPKTRNPKGTQGSIVMVVATDAPLDSRQLARVARRAPFGLARLGSPGHHGSGDFVVAFSTAHAIPEDASGSRVRFSLLSDLDLDEIFQAAEDAVEEAIVNSMLRARTVTGRAGEKAEAIPIAPLKQLLGSRLKREAR